MNRRWVCFTNSHQLVWTRVYKHPEPWLANQEDLCVPIGRITRGAVKVSAKTDRLDGGTKGGIFDPEAKGKKKKSLSSPLGQFLVVPDDPDED